MIYGRPLRAAPWFGKRPHPHRPPTPSHSNIERPVPIVATLLSGHAPLAGVTHTTAPQRIAALLTGLVPVANINRTAQPGRIQAVFAGLTPASPIGYTTLFPAAENPISEGGLWANGLSVGGNWNNVRTNVGLAYGATTSTGNADCMALLSSYIADHSIEATVYKQVGYSPGTTHDIELLVRGQLSAGNARGYVLRIAWDNAYVQIVRWNGPLSDKTILSTTVLNGGITRALVTGDVIKLRAAGGSLTGSWNGVDVITVVDSTWGTGAPGMAFLINPGGTPSSFGFSRIYAQGASASKTVEPARVAPTFTGRAPTVVSTAEPTWISTVPDVSFPPGTPATHSLSQYTQGFNASLHRFEVLSGTLPTGITLAASTGLLSYNGTSPEASASVSYRIADIPAGPLTYSTTFPANESPISEGGVWRKQATGFTNIITSGGNAIGTNGALDIYDDSYAYLDGVAFGADHEIEAVIHRGNPTGTGHEIELHVRMSDTASVVHSYEFLFNHLGGFQVMRWNGRYDEIFFTEITGQGSGVGMQGQIPANGDTIKARAQGNVLTAWFKGVQIWQGTDSTFATGKPGIATFKRTTGSNADFGFQSIIARDV